MKSITSPLISKFKSIHKNLFSTSADNSIVSKIKKWNAPLPDYKRMSTPWIKEKVVQLFAIAGSSSMVFVRPLTKYIGFSSTSLFEMTWPEKIGSFFIISPCYSVILLSIATVCGRLPFFKTIVLRMWSRFPYIGGVVSSILK